MVCRLHCMSTWCIYLHTDGVVLVDAEVKYKHLPVQGDHSEDGAGVGGPGYVTHLLRGGGGSSYEKFNIFSRCFITSDMKGLFSRFVLCFCILHNIWWNIRGRTSDAVTVILCTVLDQLWIVVLFI